MRLRHGIAWLTLSSCAVQTPLAPVPSLPAAASPAPIATLARASGSSPAASGVASEGAVVGSLPLVSLGEVGGNTPLELLASSSSGSWVALCEGEPPVATLVLGAGPGEPIDDLLAQAPNGRYVVVVQGGAVQLVDAITTQHVNLSELGADARRLRADYAEHRTLSFDAGGKQLAYLRQHGAARQLVVRQLLDGTEQVFAAGSGEVLRLRLSADARYLTFDALREDTNHNGKLDWPVPEELPRKDLCERGRQPKFRTFAYQGRGDAVVRAVVSLSSGVVRDVPELLTPLGTALLLRMPDASLQLEHANKRQSLAPASCAARVLFADAERGLVLATCAPPPPKKPKGRAAAAPSGKREVWLFGAGYAKNLQRELYETSTDRDAVAGARLVPLYAAGDASILDLERRELLPLVPGSRVLTTSGPLALVWRNDDLYSYDARSQAEQRLATGVAKNPELLQAGDAVLLSPFVVVGAAGPALVSPPRPLALTSNGFVLTGRSDGSRSARGAIQGPLQWVDARLPPPDGPPR